MPVELKSPFEHAFDGSPFLDKGTIKDMVMTYRSNHSSDKNCLKFIHFSLDEVISLFIKNGMIDPDIPISEQTDNLPGFGLKIYVGTHMTKYDTPPSTATVNPYIGKDTAILCNTLCNNRTWEDQLKVASADGNAPGNFVTITALSIGLDKGSICPPDCPPSADAYGFFHQDVTKS